MPAEVGAIPPQGKFTCICTNASPSHDMSKFLLTMLGGGRGWVSEEPVGFFDEGLEELSSAQEENVPDDQSQLLLEVGLLEDEAVEVSRHRVSNRVDEPLKVDHPELHLVSQILLQKEN